MAASAAGYSGRPLVGKLGLRPAMTVLVIDAPQPYETLVDGLPADLRRVSRASAATQFVHLFVRDGARLRKTLTALRERLPADAVVWVSWPKKMSKVATDMTEDAIREIALPLGLVDVKVCAVDEVWSGLKLMVRRELR